ncbi:UNKNOWN [Stylonychia lemnae]|uniref:Uncharacterized protein n=1 Tax=Stylonychia lemnae TaxID=5949 RepID=A0A077ZWE1_STYLE|nr:UNKNOWN [Stylonychia lemnae]|eukprot:CDW74260.1 UNKNOWN [Stylonychia lemnae]
MESFDPILDTSIPTKRLYPLRQQQSESVPLIKSINTEGIRKRLKRGVQNNDDPDMQITHSNLKRQASEPLQKFTRQTIPIQYEIKLKRINIPKDTSGLFKQFLPRLRGAQIEGFEGPKKLNIKLNKKREEHGLPPIDLEQQSQEDLNLRLKDQEELFIQLLNLNLDESLKIQRHQYETRQIRLKNIKTAQFIIPSKEAMVEQISLSDSLPFLDQSQGNRRDQYLKQMQEQAKAQIEFYYQELQNNDRTIPSVHLSQETAENLGNTPTANGFDQDLFNKALKELSQVNGETIDYQNLSILLYITQYAISDLKNSKSKKLDNIKNMKINPYELKERLKKMIV